MKPFTKYWSHKKFKRNFVGHYEVDSEGERIFVLKGIIGVNKYKRIVFESWQSAKKNGWYKE